VGELDQVLGAGLDVGADVEKQDRFAGQRQLHRQGGTLHSLEPAQPEGGGRHRRPGRAGADHRVGGVLGDVAGGEHDRGLGLGAHRRHRVLVVADPLLGRNDFDVLGAIEVELLRWAEDADDDAVFAGAASPLGKSLEAPLGAVAVEGHGDAATARHP
jgi:hypothetical protein